MVRQFLTKRLAVYLGVVRGTEQGDDLIDEPELVAGKNAKGIADDIVEAAAGKIKIDVPGFLFGSRFVEQSARDEFRCHGVVSRPSGLCGEVRGGNNNWQ